MAHCIVQDLTEGLISSEDFDRIDSIKTKPAVLPAGLECFDSVESEDGTLDTPILTDSPNLHKQRSESVSKEFIKLIRNDETEFLLKNYPNVFLLLTLIALRARLYEGHPDGLKIGESLIGDFKEAGIETEQKYRTAKEIAVRLGYIEILETCRTRKKNSWRITTDQRPTSKKSTTGITTNGTKVKILKSTIWDINIYMNNDRNNDRITTDIKKINDELGKSNTTLITPNSYLDKSEERKNHNLVPTADALGLSSLLLNNILKIRPQFKKPNLELWSKEIDRMFRIDKRTKQEIVAVIEWLPSDPFWSKNILSADKLRKQFDRLEMNMKDPKKSNFNSQKTPQHAKYNFDERPRNPDNTLNLGDEI